MARPGVCTPDHFLTSLFFIKMLTTSLSSSGDQPGTLPNLVYMVVIDGPDAEGQRFLAKMLISSLLRTCFNGDIVVFRNSETPLFLVERKGLEEVFIETPVLEGDARAFDAWCWKYRAAELLDVRGYDKVLFLDADCLALRTIDHLLEGDWGVRYQPEKGMPGDGSCYNASYTEEEMAIAKERLPVNSGTLAIRAEVFQEVMQRWQEIDEAPRYRQTGFWDQASWNALLLRHTSERPESGKWLAEPFPTGEVQFPMYLDLDYKRYSQAALTHNCGMDTLGKIQFTFGLYMRTFFCDPTGLFFSMLET
jgi:hypothetical protein